MILLNEFAIFNVNEDKIENIIDINIYNEEKLPKWKNQQKMEKFQKLYFHCFYKYFVKNSS